MRFTNIPFSAKWDNMLERMYEVDSERDSKKVINEFLKLINRPNAKWNEISEDSYMEKDGIYVDSMGSEYMYTVVYNNRLILSFQYRYN